MIWLRVGHLTPICSREPAQQWVISDWRLHSRMDTEQVDSQLPGGINVGLRENDAKRMAIEGVEEELRSSWPIRRLATDAVGLELFGLAHILRQVWNQLKRNVHLKSKQFTNFFVVTHSVFLSYEIISFFKCSHGNQNCNVFWLVSAKSAFGFDVSQDLRGGCFPLHVKFTVFQLWTASAQSRMEAISCPFGILFI